MSVPTVATKEEILDSIKKQVTENPIMLYMKGTPEMPMCGFSSKTVDALMNLDIASGVDVEIKT